MSEEFNRDDREFIAQAKQVLDRSVRQMDPALAFRLQRARLSALERRVSPRRWLIWVGGAAVASVAAVMLVLGVQQPVTQEQAAVPLDDFELVTSVEDVELAEDLDFYHWLADDDSTG